MTGMRLTLPVVKLYAALLRDPEGQHFGGQLAAAADVHIGSVYALLGRLEAAGHLSSELEVADRDLQRPRRRYYRLTPEGLAVARHVTVGLAAALAPP